MNPSRATEQKIVKTNADGGGDRHNHGDMLGTTNSAEE